MRFIHTTSTIKGERDECGRTAQKMVKRRKETFRLFYVLYFFANAACTWRLTCLCKNTSGFYLNFFSWVRGHRIFNISIKESRWQGNVLDWDAGSLNYLYYSCLLWSRRKMTVIIFKTMKQNIVTVQMIHVLTQVFCAVYKFMQDKIANIFVTPRVSLEVEM